MVTSSERSQTTREGLFKNWTNPLENWIASCCYVSPFHIYKLLYAVAMAGHEHKSVGGGFARDLE